ncbi:MAG: bifunctional ornithine acetyltransferase/N-acetylglutamate synthase [Planctomycetota bacterium]|nr:bifunctional ornithine acetyltransferase/N-acetylglutamate synthase [Planctomycetota bacterium]
MDSWFLPVGFRFCGLHSGIRPDPLRKDLALFFSDFPASAAGVFTTNKVKAAPVHLCKERLPSDLIRGIIVCSGNAIEDGIRKTAKLLSDSAMSLSDAAHAILTTDTKIKVVTKEITINGKQVVVAGVAKGAAMIGPNMATMLAFVFTDAEASDGELASLISDASDKSFNCVSVEGHTSTNDSLIILANGASGAGKMLGGDWDAFVTVVTEVCCELAKEIAIDAEGANHLVTITVEGLRDDKEAKKIAKTVAESVLVKTAIYGSDPNWGRVVSAAGYAGVNFEEKNLTLWMGEMILYKDGTPMDFDPKVASDYLKNNRNVTLRLIFNLGKGKCTYQTCDLTQEYVRLNADYTT